MTFDEFDDTARELFGLEPWESADLAERLVAEGVDLDVLDADNEHWWGYVADSEALGEVMGEDFQEDMDYERYTLDPYFPDDDYLDPGEFWEMTAEAYFE